MNTDYPRMLFQQATRQMATVHSREEEDALGPGWSRRIWQDEAASVKPDPAPVPEPEPPLFVEPDPEPDPEPEPAEEVPVEAPAPKRRGRPPGAAKTAPKKAVRRSSK